MIVLEGFDPAMLMSANQRPHWAVKAERTAFWRGLGAKAALKANLTPVDRARIVVAYRFPNNIRRDVGNFYPTSKAILDGIVDAGCCIKDDSDQYIEGPDQRRDYPNGPHRITITIQEIP